MKIVCMSDIHGQYSKFQFDIPDGDVFVFTGDISQNTLEDLNVKYFNKFLNSLPHKHKVIICGNHDFIFEKKDGHELLVGEGIHYLQDEEIIIDGVKFYGSPWQPWFYNWAFNLKRGKALADIWAKIPDDVNILLTHGAPKGILDVAPSGDVTGCEDLMNRVKDLKDLKLHCFGHIHCAYGIEVIEGVTFVNASTCNEEYYPSNPPIVVEI